MQATSSVVSRQFELPDGASARRTRVLGWIALGMIAVALALVFLAAPRAQDSAGGNAQRIFYFHLSSAWIGFGAWIVAAVAGGLYLRRRDLKYDRVAVASAEIGVLFIALVLLSGMLWARPVWNTWWTWDFKLTLSALQFLMYVAYLMLRSGIDDINKRARFAAVYGIVGALTVPLNFLVSRVLQSIHPAVFGPSANEASKGGTGIETLMAVVLVYCLATFTVLFVYLVRSRFAIQARADALEARRAELAGV